MGAPALAPVAAPIFVARGLTKIYRMGDVDVPALRGIDLDLCEGEFVVLLGPSGSGRKLTICVFAIRGSRARVQPVTLGHAGEDEVEVLTGIAEGDQVVAHPSDEVRDGVRVRTRRSG